MPEYLLSYSLSGSRRWSRGEGGVGRDGSAELRLSARGRRWLFFVPMPGSALRAWLSGNTVGLLWFIWFWVSFLFLCLFTFCILFSFLIFNIDGFTWIILVSSAIVTFVICIKFFYEGWEDWKPDMLKDTLLQNFCKKKNNRKHWWT